ncbi:MULTISPECIES: glycosyltransferase [Rhodococcus]|uniref:glycosyltransferase n=1 Tax=Rhodococcus TaxID=1827 RepID=UPI001356AE06|nr:MULTISPECIES: glycosyltransferase [Rhodococcus]KAF0963847.1 4'-demethylrebeccamycin synthase [Rhodococcus sp. T7]UOT08322.1 glycosyltransferase [Rhodococcus opacus]
MADIVIVTFDAGGNVPPALGIGRELRKRGHRVRVLGHQGQRPVVEAAGLEFRGYRNSPRWPPHTEVSTWTVLTMGLTMVTDPGIGCDLREVVRDDPADLVVIDCMLFNALDAAARAGLPHAALFHTFYAAFDGSFRHGPFGIVPRLKGLGPRRLWRQADLALVCSDPVLDPAGTRSHDGHLVWTGAVHDAKAAAVGRTPPRVLASLSTSGFPGQRRALQNILDAAEDTDIELVVTTGPAIDPAAFRVPANASVHRYLPHNEVMPTCSAVIGHGGHATAFRALAHGLPMLILPMSALTDQRTIGKTVAATGAGKVLRKTAKPNQIRAALDELLASESYRTAAATLGARIRATDGASAAADQLLTLIDR